MTVWCRQTVGGRVVDGPYQVAPHFDGQTDAELLGAKRKGAADKGWAVEITGPRSFTATKVRWESSAECVRDFWAD
jgi:hypothetical protein